MQPNACDDWGNPICLTVSNSADSSDEIASLRAQLQQQAADLAQARRDLGVYTDLFNQIFDSLRASDVDMTGINETRDIPGAINRLTHEKDVQIEKLEAAFLSLYFNHAMAILDSRGAGSNPDAAMRATVQAREALEAIRRGTHV